MLTALILLAGVARAQPPKTEPDRQLERLKRWLNSEDESLRTDAVSELSSLQKPEAVPLLLQALKDSNVVVRNQAAWSLQNFRDPRVVPALRETLKDQDDRVRASAVWSLSRAGKSVLPDVINMATNDASGIVRFRAVWGLANIGDKSALPVVVQTLGDYNNSVRERSALLALEALADKSVTPLLLTQRTNILPATRRIVMYLLAKYPDKSVLPALYDGLKDDDPLVRAEAAISLGKLRARVARAESKRY